MSHRPLPLAILSFTLCAVLSFFTPPASAADGTWKLSASGSWQTPENWLGGIPSAPGDTATFGPLVPSSPISVSLTAPTTIGTLNLANANTITIQGPAVSPLIFEPLSGPARINVLGGTHAINATLQVDAHLELNVAYGSQLKLGASSVPFLSQIKGSGGLTLTGGGTVSLATANAGYTGPTTVANGVLSVGHSLALGVGLGTDADGTSIGPSGTVIIQQPYGVPREKFTFTGGTLIGSTEGPLHFAADSVLGAGTFGGAVSGPAGFRVLPGATVILNGSNTYSGRTVINDGWLEISTATALGAGGSHATGTTVGAKATLFARSVPLIDEFITLSGGTLQSLKTSGAVSLEKDSLIIGGEFTGPITGSGGLTLDGGPAGYVSISGDNSYTGHTYVRAGSVRASSPHAFGSTADTTTVNGGHLSLFAPTLEPVTVQAGSLTLETPIYSGPITMAGGTLATSSAYVTLTSPLNLTTDATITGRSRLTLAAPVQGHGDLIFRANNADMQIDIDAPLQYHGNLVFRAGAVNLNSVNPAFAGRFILNSDWAYGGYPAAALNVNQDLTANLDLIAGRLAIAPGKTLTSLEPDLEFQGVSISGNLRGVSRLTKTTYKTGALSNLPPDSHVAIDIQRGVVRVETGGLASAAVATTVASRNAALQISTPAPIAENIFLHNAAGPDFHGGLIVSDVGPVTLTGTLDLGSEGSLIGFPATSALQLTGPITGGSLTIVGSPGTDPGIVRITTPASTYTGQTVVGRGNLRATLELASTGRLSTTSAVLLGRSGTLFLNNTPTNSSDRVADTIPVQLHGGTISLGSASLAHSAETLGSVSAALGHSHIKVTSGSDPSETSTLTINSLERAPSATLNFTGAFAPVDSPAPGPARLLLSQPPVLTGGLLGGWATVDSAAPREADFATYGPHGIAAFTSYRSGFAAAAPSDTVQMLGAETLTADQSINALKIATKETLDLGGHTLTLNTGGLIKVPGATWTSSMVSSISNGRLTVGPEANQELLIYSRDAHLTVDADITDNEVGPVSLVSSGSYLRLAGQNTYTGPTIVNHGTLALRSPSALPSGTDLYMNGGYLAFDYGTSTPLHVGDVVVREGGGAFMIDAASYLLESGTLSNIAGSGPLTKTTLQYAELAGTNTAYTGPITIQAGLLHIHTTESMGGGTITVSPGAALTLGDDYRHTYQAPISLSGDLFLSPTTTTTLNTLHLSDVPLILSYQPAKITGPVTIADHTSVSSDGTGTLTLSGQVRPGADTHWSADDGSLAFTGSIAAATYNSRLTLAGSAPITLDATLGADTDRHLTLAIAPEASVTATKTLTIPQRVTFAVDGQFQGTGITISGNGELTGTGTLEGPVSNAGHVSPGDSAGTLSITAGAYTQTSTGILDIELGGPASGHYDRLVVDGPVTLAGTLNISLIDYFSPAIGDSFDILDFTSLTGAFTQLNLPTLSPDRRWSTAALYTTGTLRVLPDVLLGDTNRDGRTDALDISSFVQRLVSRTYQTEADCNYDGLLNSLDIACFVQTLNGAASAQPVPEPTAGVCLLTFALFTLPHRRLPLSQTRT